MSTAPSIRLGPTRYGKAVVRLVKLLRESERHDLRDVRVDVALEGDFERCFVAGDNTDMPATDTMRNVVYAMAREHALDSIEAFGLQLARHYRTLAPTVTGAEVRLTEQLWHRIMVGGAEHNHAFTRGAGERTAVVRAGSGGISVEAGLDNLMVLKTTASGWSNFHHDRHTTLPDADDRILATSVTATWSYGARTELPFNELWEGIKERILETFTDHYSPSVQHTIYRMGRAVLEVFPDVERISFALPNKHHLLYNLAPFGLDNPGEIFHVTSEPYGLIEGTVEREG
jgi:urate oxidase